MFSMSLVRQGQNWLFCFISPLIFFSQNITDVINSHSFPYWPCSASLCIQRRRWSCSSQSTVRLPPYVSWLSINLKGQINDSCINDCRQAVRWLIALSEGTAVDFYTTNSVCLKSEWAAVRICRTCDSSRSFFTFGARKGSYCLGSECFHLTYASLEVFIWLITLSVHFLTKKISKKGEIMSVCTNRTLPSKSK